MNIPKVLRFSVSLTQEEADALTLAMEAYDPNALKYSSTAGYQRRRALLAAQAIVAATKAMAKSQNKCWPLEFDMKKKPEHNPVGEQIKDGRFMLNIAHASELEVHVLIEELSDALTMAKLRAREYKRQRANRQKNPDASPSNN